MRRSVDCNPNFTPSVVLRPKCARANDLQPTSLTHSHAARTHSLPLPAQDSTGFRPNDLQPTSKFSLFHVFLPYSQYDFLAGVSAAWFFLVKCGHISNFTYFTSDVLVIPGDPMTQWDALNTYSNRSTTYAYLLRISRYRCSCVCPSVWISILSNINSDWPLKQSQLLLF